MTDEQLEQVFNDLLDADCISEMSAVLTPLPNDQLEAVYEDLLNQYGPELTLGALERSEWLCGTLIINANQSSICFLRTALDAIRDEIQRRKAAWADGETR